MNNVVALCYSVLISRCFTRTTDNVLQNVLCTFGAGTSINSQVESFYCNFQVALNHITGWVGSVVKKLTIHNQEHFSSVRRHAGNPSSKYELRRTSALLLRNMRNIRICMGKKPIVSVIYENERISIKKLTLLKMCVASLLCGPRADLWPFYGFLCKRFSLYSVSI